MTHLASLLSAKKAGLNQLKSKLRRKWIKSKERRRRRKRRRRRRRKLKKRKTKTRKKKKKIVTF